MSQIIVTSRYLKSGTETKRKNYTRYIATRETVEIREQNKIDREAPATEKQPVSYTHLIDKKDRLSYYEALEEYAVNNNLMLFADMIATLEEQQLQRCVDMTQDMTPEIQNFEQQQNM